MTRRAGLTLICVGLLLGACQRPPTATAPKVRTIVDSAADARAALVANDCARAVPHLRRALVNDSDSLFLHFNLGMCADRLGARDETILQFSWVVANVEPASAEAQTARRWLNEAGVLAEDPISEAKEDATVGDSTLRGTVAWGELGRASAPRGRQQLFLKGLPGTPTKELQYVRRSDDSGHFEFKNVTPGTYRLIDVIAGQPTWRLRVSLEPGQEMVVDLRPENAASVRDDFPDH
jgi:hypothetical protein